jgi:adenylate cyclase
MESRSSPRHLAAVMVADLVGYSRMVAADETDTLARVAALMAGTVRPAVARYGGRVVKGTGDGFMGEFPSAVEAVACAAAIHEAMAAEAAGVAPERRLKFRIGINLGDIIAGDDGDIYGDGVNIAARLEPLAEPGGIAISAKVLAEVRGRLKLVWADGGARMLKNIPDPVHVYLHGPGTAVQGPAPAATAARARIAVLPFRGPSHLGPGLAWLTAMAIARCPRLAVTATAEAEALGWNPGSVRDRAAELGLRAVLEASVAETHEGVRVDARLIDPRNGNHLLAWAEAADTAALPRVPTSLAAAIARRAGAPEPSPEALPIRDPSGFAALLRGLGAAAAEDSLAAYEDAVAADPSSALAHALLAHAYGGRIVQDPGAQRDAESLGGRALGLDPADARTLALAAAALARAGNPDAAASAARAATAMAGGDAEAAALLAAAGLVPSG